MKRGMVRISLAAIALVFAGAASAEDGVLELWECTLNEGKSMDDVRAANASWLKFQNAANPDAGIRSWALTSVVGDSATFAFMDGFPSLDAWAKAKAAVKSPQGQAVEAALLAAATCTQNRLFEASEH